ncbi:abortive infection family protein [Mucilaginibacter rubeus]|uniref:Abortive infection family protein n=1 Tax=Mucilaginibacter rubeus TaxID=2027860 RepID=A0A5C1I4D3_9SPHI|nr:abortive infection family protein [Mucilaginibacter rubeus]QEM12957.1 abortive infection family protein [Mucilaginibacter rubeus]
MEDNDIRKIRKVLSYKGRDDLADLIRYSKSTLDESSTYGSRLYSRLSTFTIFSPPSKQKNIEKLSEDDKSEIFNAVLLVYPLGDNEPEIKHVEYLPDFDSEEENVVEVKELERISFEFIHQQIKKCNNKIAEKDFDGAVTNARSLIESVSLFIVENIKKEKVEYDGNLIKLYKQVALLLKMSPGDYEDSNLKQILSGVFSIINGVSSLRNDYSDAHGLAPSKTSYKIDERHAILTINLSKTISEYLFLSYEKTLT